MKRSIEEAFVPGERPPLPLPAEHLCRALAPLALPERLERIEQAVAARLRSVIAVVDSLHDPHNAAAIMRSCDGFGVGELHAIEADKSVMITTRVTKGCEKWMDLRRHASAEACAAHLRARGYALFVADMRATRALDEIAELPRVALAFGNEHAGVSPALRGAADGAFSVPMRGMVESFNVSVAAAVTLYAVTRGRVGDLAPDDAMDVRARFLMASVREPELVAERYAREHGLPWSGLGRSAQAREQWRRRDAGVAASSAEGER